MAVAASSLPAATLSPWSMASLRATLPAVSCACFSTTSRYPALRSLRSGVNGSHKSLRSFSGLAPVVHIPSASVPGKLEEYFVLTKFINKSTGRNSYNFQIHHEVSKLKKLVESYLEWQAKLECFIKQEVSFAVDQLCGTGKLMKDFN